MEVVKTEITQIVKRTEPVIRIELTIEEAYKLTHYIKCRDSSQSCATPGGYSNCVKFAFELADKLQNIPGLRKGYEKGYER